MSNQTITVTVPQIISGLDTGMPQATLNWGDSVSYQLGSAAAALFKFKAVSEALTLSAAGRDVLGDVTLYRSDSVLTVTAKPNTGPWTAKGTLFFLPLLDQLPAAGGLDPTIGNSGHSS